MIRLILAALAVLLAAGCGPTMEYWCHPTKIAVEAFPKEKYQCQTEAYKRASLLDEKGDKDVIEKEWNACMKARGWFICEGPKKKDAEEVQP